MMLAPAWILWKVKVVEFTPNLATECIQFCIADTCRNASARISNHRNCCEKFGQQRKSDQIQFRIQLQGGSNAAIKFTVANRA